MIFFLYGNAVSCKARKRLRRNAATVFELSIAEHAQRAFGGTYNLFLLYGNAVSYKAKNRSFQNGQRRIQSFVYSIISVISQSRILHKSFSVAVVMGLLCLIRSNRLRLRPY